MAKKEKLSWDRFDKGNIVLFTVVLIVWMLIGRNTSFYWEIFSLFSIMLICYIGMICFEKIQDMRKGDVK